MHVVYSLKNLILLFINIDMAYLVPPQVLVPNSVLLGTLLF